MEKEALFSLTVLDWYWILTVAFIIIGTIITLIAFKHVLTTRVVYSHTQISGPALILNGLALLYIIQANTKNPNQQIFLIVMIAIPIILILAIHIIYELRTPRKDKAREATVIVTDYREIAEQAIGELGFTIDQIKKKVEDFNDVLDKMKEITGKDARFMFERALIEIVREYEDAPRSRRK